MLIQQRRNLWWLLAIAVVLATMAAALGAATRTAINKGPVAAAGDGARTELRDAMLATPDARRGEDLYAPCGACHGPDGRGVVDGSVPAIAGQHYTVIAKQLVDFRHGQRWDIQMEHAARMQHLATGQDLADVAMYVSTLPRGFGAGKGDGENLGVGAATFFERCERCHGPLGQGNSDRGIPRLAGQHYAYLYRQFFDAVENGRPSLSKVHVDLMAPLERAEIVGISDYLSRTGTGLVHDRP